MLGGSKIPIFFTLFTLLQYLSPQPSRRVNQSGACSGSDVITSGPRKSETTMEDKLIVVVCGYPELYIDLRTFTKTGIHFATRLELPGRRPSHDANSRLLCIVSEFHARMARISRANEASKVKMFKRFIRVWCERTHLQRARFLR